MGLTVTSRDRVGHHLSAFQTARISWSASARGWRASLASRSARVVLDCRRACEHVGGGESAVHAPFAECARAFPQVGGGAGLTFILDRDDGGDEIRPRDGGDVLAHEPPEAAA